MPSPTVAVDNQLAPSDLRNNPVISRRLNEPRETDCAELRRARAHSSGSGSAQVARSAAAVAASASLYQYRDQAWLGLEDADMEIGAPNYDGYAKSPPMACQPSETRSAYHLDRADRRRQELHQAHLEPTYPSKWDKHLMQATASSNNAEPVRLGPGEQDQFVTGSAFRQTSPKRNPSPLNVSSSNGEAQSAKLDRCEPNPAASGQRLNGANSDEDLDEQIRMDLLRKSSFTCMLVGARQTGKRSIVKCFVKLLNEFKLALDEYRKERMLTKLMDCSERLQALSDQQLDRRPSSLEQANKTWQRARGNSWLSGSHVDRWLRLPSISGVTGPKRRLNSMMVSSRPQLLVTGSEFNQQRRHTTIEHDATSLAEHEQRPPFQVSQGRFLSVGDGQNMLSSCNKSDFNIDYQGEAGSSESSVLQRLQLQVPLKSPAGQGTGERRSSERPLSGACRLDASLDTGTRRSMQFLPSAADNGNQLAELRLRNQSIQMEGRRRQVLSLKELNKRRIKIKFKTRRQLSDRHLQLITLQRNNHDKSKERAEIEKNACTMELELPDSFMIVYSVNDRESFDYAKSLLAQLKSIKCETPLPIVLVANKIDLERAKVIKSDEGRLLARRNACKFMETSCTVGFNLDNLLVGLRTQLILKHHITINSILRYGKAVQPHGSPSHQNRSTAKAKGTDNILVRFYKRYLVDNDDLDYECDNFSKL